MKLDHIVILLSDLEANLPFYEDLLPMIGFSKQRDHVFGNEDGVYLDIKQAEEATHEYRRYSPGLNHLGFTAPDLNTVVNIQSRMRDAGYQTADIQHFSDGQALFLKDNDGMRIEVACYD